MMKKFVSIVFFTSFLFVQFCFAQSSIDVYPVNWFVGMKNKNLQLMIHSPNIASNAEVSISYPGIDLVRTNKVENPNYLFLDLKVYASAKPGTVKIKIRQGS